MKKVLKKLGIVSLVWFLAIPVSGQVVINTNANGAGSLADAINSATAGSTITFNIPGAGPYIINTTLNQINKSLTIDATSQPGWVAGKPIVILRGNGGGNGFDVKVSNVTIRGFIIQNFQSGYYQDVNVTGNTIDGCWFGLDATGTTVSTASKLTRYGAEIKAGSATIGSTDRSLAKRNVIAGCGLGGVIFGEITRTNGAAKGSVLGNSYIGTDTSGTLPLGNGTGELHSEYRHGVLVVYTPKVTIRDNVVSSNISGGIDIFGASDSCTIAGNKIGTDATGTKPLGNNTFGIRVTGSNAHTIGGNSALDRNIVSANGSDFFDHKPQNDLPDHFDWYNSCGIYLLRSNNSTIQGNYIGVDASGNKHTLSAAYDIGNFYVGIKIEGTSTGNKVIGNVVGGNGFRSSVAAFNATPKILFFDGHGMIIKDKGTINTSVTGNYVGVGADGNSKVGNMQDGISLQGCSSTVVGGATVAERNIIGDNTWGIFIATNYWDSQALNNKVYGNYIGTNKDGSLPIGNGTRTGLTSGGGIGIVHHTRGTLIGGAANGQGNVIAGNRLGISIMGDSPPGNSDLNAVRGQAVYESKVYGNLIGLAANGTTILKNLTNGIYIGQGAYSNEIGGAVTGQGNKIVGNDSTGILSSAGINNKIQGNIITNNKKDGIRMYTGSTGNAIGGVTLAEGNIIEDNTGNGIYIVGATSNNNPIRRNQISCNTLRGIELNGTGNGNYGKPTFTGSPANLIVTGPGAVGSSYIELYSLDACNDCSTGSNNKLQGKTLVASGNSPLTFTGGASGAFYTATATSLTNPLNTSEFSDCYNLCVPPIKNIPVRGSTVCKGENGRVTVLNAQNIAYQAYKGANAVGPIATGANGVANLIVYADSLKTDTTIIVVKGRPNGSGCGFVSLDSLATVIVNTPPSTTSDITTNGPVCVGTRGTLTVVAPEKGKYYQVFEGNDKVSDSIVSPGTAPLALLLKLLAPGSHTLRVKVGVTGCAPSFLAKQVEFVVDSNVKKDLVVKYTTPICVGSNAIVTIEKSELRKTYTVYENATALGSGAGNGGNLNIPIANLSAGNHKLYIYVQVPGCKSDTLTGRPSIDVNSVPDSNLRVGSNGPVCGGDQASFLIYNSQVGKTYKIYHNADVVSKDTLGNGGTLAIKLFNLVPGTYELRAKASSAGCAKSIELKDSVILIINSYPKTDLDAIVNGPVCKGNPAIVTVIKSEAGKTYSVYYGRNLVSDTVKSTGQDSLKITVYTQNIPKGVDRPLSISVKVPGCTPDTLTKRPLLTINDGLSLDTHKVVAVPSVICINTDGLVRVSATKVNEKYQAYIGTEAVSVEVVSSGTSVDLTIPASKLKQNWNLVSVKIFVAGCGYVNLGDTAGIKVNPNPRLDLAISVAPAEICQNSPSYLKVATSEVGVWYQAQLEDGTKIGNAEIGNGDTVRLTLTNIPLGENKIFVIASVGGCISRALDSNVVVKVNNGTTTDYNVTGDSVCKGNAGIVRISGSKIGIDYFVVIKSTGRVISDTVAGTGAPISIRLEISTNPVDTIQVMANVPGCGPIALDKSALVFTNDNSTSKGLPTRGSTVCASEQFAAATIIGAKVGITYTAYKLADGTRLADNTGDGSDVRINIPTKLLESGANVIYFVATVAGCDSVRLDSNAVIYIIGGSVSIKGKGLVCYNTEGEYSIAAIPGVSIYDWTVTGDAVIVSGDSTNKILVKFGQQNTTISMAPVGSIGSCQLTDSKIDVRVEPPYDGELDIIGPDMVCVNDISRIFADSIGEPGVDRIDWTWSGGIDMIDTLSKKSVFKLYDVKFAQTGWQTITATPHITCKDSLGKADTLMVRVLGYPVAEANSYDPIADFSKLIPLNGTGSTLNGAPPADSLTYSWTADDKRLEIYNPNSLNGASFKPIEIETWVQLTVTNLKGMCPDTSRARIIGKPTIDIPNVFSPNNDGTHDYWEIKNLNALYPNVTVEVFNKWGSQVYKSNGYAKPWDGTRNGEELPVATYYYIVDLKNGDKPYVRDVTIIR